MNMSPGIKLTVLCCAFMLQYAAGQDTLRLAFGSCDKADQDQSFWPIIASDNPDAWIWLGDIVYSNSMKAKIIKKKYKELKNNHFYSDFSNQMPVYGVWDDNDYGDGDGGKDYKLKLASRNILYDFLNIPKSNPAWDREGAYQSYHIEKAGISVRLILLDVRYFRDKLEPNTDGSSRYLANPKAEILGDQQWEWLEKELSLASEDVVIIGSGTQIIPEEHPYEKWADYPTERMRLFNLLNQYSQKRIVLLSGDRHMAEASAIALNGERFLYELTSSGLTHTWTQGDSEPNGYRIRELFPVKNYGIIEVIKSENEMQVIADLKTIDGHLLDRYEIYPQ
jgi:alkaline phosphatase D